jgi:hypothetical protein
MAAALDPAARTFRGILLAVRARPLVAAAVAAAVWAFNLLAPVGILSLARKPADFFTFNPWLPRLPAYLASSELLGAKLDFLWHLRIAWVSADGATDVDWAFVLDVPTLVRLACIGALFGLYFALASYQRRIAACQGGGASRPAGVVGAATSIFGLTTCPCTLAGCGAPVLPVVGLAFTGLPAATLSLFATVSSIAMAALVCGLGAAILWIGYRIGGDAQGSPRFPAGKVQPAD